METKENFIHPSARCETLQVGMGTRIWGNTHILKGAEIGENCNICEQVYIESQVIIGNGCKIKNGVSIWDGVELADHVFIGPHVCFTNDRLPRAFIEDWKHRFKKTLVLEGASIGANATIVCGVTIGKYAFIGAGALVSRDVPDHGLILGNPGRLVGRVCFCGTRLVGEFCEQCDLVLSENNPFLATKNAKALSEKSSLLT